MLSHHKESPIPIVGWLAAPVCCRAMRALQNVYFQEAERLAKVGVSVCDLTTASLRINSIWPLAGWSDAPPDGCVRASYVQVRVHLCLSLLQALQVCDARDCSSTCGQLAVHAYMQPALSKPLIHCLRCCSTEEEMKLPLPSVLGPGASPCIK